VGDGVLPAASGGTPSSASSGFFFFFGEIFFFFTVVVLVDRPLPLPRGGAGSDDGGAVEGGAEGSEEGEEDFFAMAAWRKRAVISAVLSCRLVSLGVLLLLLL
jgi:hypothetical protein